MDAKLSTVLSIDTAILATMSAAMPAASQVTIFAGICVGAAAIALVFSFAQLYKESFPKPEGRSVPHYFFSDIAARNEEDFITTYRA